MTKREEQYVKKVKNKIEFDEICDGCDYRMFSSDFAFTDVFNWIFEDKTRLEFDLYHAVINNHTPEELEQIYFLEEEQQFVFRYGW